MRIGRSRTFWWLVATYSLLVFATTGILGVVVHQWVEHYGFEQVEENLRMHAFLIAQDLQDLGTDAPVALQPRVDAMQREINSRVTVLASDGRVLADSSEDPARLENHLSRPEVVLAREKGIGTFIHRSQISGRPMMMYFARRVEGTDGKTVIGFVRVARSLDSIRDDLARIRKVIWSVGGSLFAAAICIAIAMAWRMAGPLQELTAGAQTIAAGEFGRQVRASGKDEIGVLGRTFNLMSERLAAQFAQLEQDREQLRAVLNGMVEGVIALDGQQRILFANRRADRLLEFPASSVVGRSFPDLVRQPDILEIVRQSLQTVEPVKKEVVWDSTGPRTMMIHAARLSDSPTGGVVLVLADVSELRRLERIRQEFVANVSHELKTPLSVIKACIETLLNGAVDDRANRDYFMQQINEGADRLHHLILDLLHLARIESGEMEFHYELLPVYPTITACLERYRTMADAKDQQLVTPPPDAAEVWADPEVFDQVLDNLVDNAVKYTPKGGHISVGWHLENGDVFLEVKDDGIGIPESDLPRVFERFYRVDRARSRELGGTGLGLSIVKHLVQGMAGSVWAESKPGCGTTFFVRLPRAPASNLP